MKNYNSLAVQLLLVIFMGFGSELYAQELPAMYFCEQYGENGEVNISDRFTTGYLTVVVKSNYALNLKSVHIQFDKYNFSLGHFEFYKKFNFTLEPDMNYVYFSKNDESDMSFDDPGFYRVYLLDDQNNTKASAIVEIIDN
jgi:hypothetical protein